MENHRLKKDRMVEEDRISQLPDNILSVILSSLTMRDAVRTSVLSNRWRYLWTTSLSNLKFDVHNMLDKEYSDIDINEICAIQQLIIPWKRMLNFVNSVQQFLLNLRWDHRIHKLKVHFQFFRNKYGRHLDEWIGFAISRGVEELDLDLSNEGYIGTPDDGEEYDFPCDLLVDLPFGGRGREGQFLKCLRLRYCILAPNNPNLVGFNFLTTLDLQCVDLLGNEHVENLLSNCSLLEWLSFYECIQILHLKIGNPSSRRLKYLEVNNCYNLKVIEIFDIDLAMFEYSGPLISFIFSKVPRLVTLFSHVPWEDNVSAITRLPIHLPQLQTWMVRCICNMKEGLMPIMGLPTFAYLKHLVIIEIKIFKRDLLWIASLLKASPLLQKLELHLSTYDYVEEAREINRPSRCPHEHLKEVEITGTRGYLSEIEIAIYLLNNAIALKKMMIDPRVRYYIGDGKWEVSEACDKWKMSGRPKIFEHLPGEVCPLVELVVL